MAWTNAARAAAKVVRQMHRTTAVRGITVAPRPSYLGRIAPTPRGGVKPTIVPRAPALVRAHGRYPIVKPRGK